MKKSNEVLYINYLRLLACLLVLLTHSTLPAVEDSLGFYLAGLSFLGSPSSELFIAVSGSLLLPVKLSPNEFYKKRFTKLVYPVFIWSLVYLGIEFFKGAPIDSIIKSFILLPLKPVHGVFWFIYVISGLYLFLPIISKWLLDAQKSEIQFFLGIWGVTLILPLFNLIVPDFVSLKGSYYETLNYFGGFLGYMILGFYLRKYPIKFSSLIYKIIFFSGILLLAIIPIGACYFIQRSAIPILMDNLSINSVLFVVFYFTLMQNIKIRHQKFNQFISRIVKYSFGIYLIHILVIREIIWNITSVPLKLGRIKN